MNNIIPFSDPEGITCIYDNTKLTKREQFAAMAMLGLMANSEHYKMGPKSVAKASIEMADELIEQLK